MKLTPKVTLLLVGVIAATFAINFVVLNTTVMSSFVQIERDTAERNADRVKKAIDREAEFLKSMATDWAFWTDTHNFVSDQSGDYVEQNLIDTTLIGLNVNTLILFDKEGAVLWGLSLDLDSEEEANSPNCRVTKTGVHTSCFKNRTRAKIVFSTG